MTAFYKIVAYGYIVGVGTNGNDSVTAITESEYAEIMSVIQNKPADPDGYQYRLRADNLEWELVETPEPEPVDEDAKISDYENALSELGVQFND